MANLAKPKKAKPKKGQATKDPKTPKNTQNLTHTVLFQFYNEMSILENKMFKICPRFVNSNIAKN